VKVKNHWRIERHFVVGREEEQCVFDGSQALSARPSDKGRVKVKMLEWLQSVA
jgi:hypothetical protein